MKKLSTITALVACGIFLIPVGHAAAQSTWSPQTDDGSFQLRPLRDTPSSEKSIFQSTGFGSISGLRPTKTSAPHNSTAQPLSELRPRSAKTVTASATMPKYEPRQEPEPKAQQEPQIEAPRQQEEYNLLPMKDIRSTRIDIRETNPTRPQDLSDKFVHGNGQDWFSNASSDKYFAWTAPDIRYQPLYFENVQLERYGQTPGDVREVFLSGFHFLSSAILAPIHMKDIPPHGCDYPLGFCRPGSVVPYSTEKLWYGNPFRPHRSR